MDFKSKATTAFTKLGDFKLPVFIVVVTIIISIIGIERNQAIKEAVKNHEAQSETRALDDKVKLRKQVFQRINEEGGKLEAKRKEVESLERTVESLSGKLEEVDAQIVDEVNRISLKK